MRQHLLIQLNMDDSIIEPHYTDALDDRPFLFELDAVDNPLDQDDPESALHDYLMHTFGRRA